MGESTKIEWTDSTWTPVKGCSRESEGCRNCYAEIMAARFNGPGQWGEGLAEIVTTPTGKDHRWTGKVRFDGRELVKPLRWRKHRRIFVCSTADLFHPSVPDEWIDRVFAVMALAPQHTFQVLTKRPARMRAYLEQETHVGRLGTWARVTGDGVDSALRAAGIDWDGNADDRHSRAIAAAGNRWPLPNVWLGVSAEDQPRADERIPELLATLAAVRFVSLEPLLGPVDLEPWVMLLDDLEPALDWVIAGGESGPGARPTHPDWFRSLRDQCAAAGVAFHFKQFGEWMPARPGDEIDAGVWMHRNGDTFRPVEGERFTPAPLSEHIVRVGKKAAGRLLDGVTHDGFPS